MGARRQGMCQGPVAELEGSPVKLKRGSWTAGRRLLFGSGLSTFGLRGTRTRRAAAAATWKMTGSSTFQRLF